MMLHMPRRNILAGLFVTLFMLCVQGGRAVLPPTIPPWPPTYDFRESLITMQVNGSGFSSPERGAEFGIVSYDWSNMKQLWAANKPMNCEELLLEQAIRTKKAGAKHVFVYRNIVKALPWFSTVRQKLNDPAYADFFLKFAHSSSSHDSPPTTHVPKCAAENASLCSVFYHDQLQTPQVPTATNPKPDGSCNTYCDCGMEHPCGEYIFNHRNGTMLRNFLVEEVVMGAILKHPFENGNVDKHPSPIDGVFLDDYWCSNLICDRTGNKVSGCPCDDPVQGPTEVDPFNQVDMGLSDFDIMLMTKEWNTTMTHIQRALLDKNAYTWSLMYGQENANAFPQFLHGDDSTRCVHDLKDACLADSIWQRHAMLFGFTVATLSEKSLHNETGTDSSPSYLPQLHQDLAFFLLVRGPFAWAGFGTWGMTWPFNSQERHGALPPLPHGIPLPTEFYVDYGVPLELCYESMITPGVFHREWSRASVKLDCNTFQAHITTKNNSTFQ